MKLKKILPLGGLAFGLLLSQAALADDSFQYKYREAAIATELESPLNPAEDFSGDVGSGEMGPATAAANLSNVQNCIGSYCSALGTVRPLSGYRSVPLSAFLPPVIGGEADLLSSPALATYEQVNIANPYKVFRTTLHLTEGAVAAGISDANQDVANKMLNQRLAQVETLLAAEAMPESKLFVKEYYNCIQRRVALGESNYMAVGNCRNDRMMPIPNVLSLGTTFFSGTGVNFGEDSPAHPSRVNGGGDVGVVVPPAMPFVSDGSTYTPQDQIRLTDLLFNEEIAHVVQTSGAFSQTNGPFTAINAFQYANDFSQRYGDMVWGVASLTLPSGTTGGTLLNTAKTAVWGVVPASLDSAEGYQNRIGDIFQKLTTVIYGRCLSMSVGTGSVTVSDSAFFSSVLSKEDVTALSTVGLAFSPDILSEFVTELEVSSGTGPFTTGHVNCSIVDPLTLLASGGAGIGGWSGVIRNLSGSEKTNSLYRLMYAYARLLALNQLLLEAKTTIRFLDSLSAAANDGTYQEYVTMAKKLVMKSLGNIELDDAISNSRNELSLLVNSVGQRQQREMIAAGKSFTSPKLEDSGS